MCNFYNKNSYADSKEDVLDDPQVVELITKYTEDINNRRLVPEEFIVNNRYQGPAREEILQEMRFADALEYVYSNERPKDSEEVSEDRTREVISTITKAVLSKLQTSK